MASRTEVAFPRHGTCALPSIHRDRAHHVRHVHPVGQIEKAGCRRGGGGDALAPAHPPHVLAREIRGKDVGERPGPQLPARPHELVQGLDHGGGRGVGPTHEGPVQDEPADVIRVARCVADAGRSAARDSQ